MKKIRVSIIDNEKDFIMLVKINLELTGKYMVDPILGRTIDMMARLKDFKPDIILLDMIMPEVSGVDVCREIKKDEFLKNVPIVILTAHERDEDKVKAMEAGAAGYLMKPISRDELMAKIDDNTNGNGDGVKKGKSKK